MDRNRHSTVSATLPAVTSSGNPAGFFTKGDGNIIPATVPTADWANGITEELRDVITHAGITPSISDNTQVKQGIQYIAKNESKLKQVVVATSNTFQVVSGIIPVDDTIPTSTEGTQILSASITPSSATSTLLVEVVINASPAVAPRWTIGTLFLDNETSARTVTWVHHVTSGGVSGPIVIKYHMTAGSTTLKTFKVRVGCNDGINIGINGAWDGISSLVRYFGGALQSYIEVKEILN